MRKKSIFVFCFMLFLLYLGTNTIHAQMRTFEIDGINYRVIQEPDGTMTTGTVSVCQIEYGEYEGDIVIPNAVKETSDQYADKYKVVSIDNSAFSQTKNLKSVKLPPSIESIGDSTFFLSSVVRVDMPIGNLKVIGESVFEQSKLDSIDIPSTIKVIGKNAFSNCVELKSVILHEGLTSIGNGAFHTCINLETLHLPNTLKAIGNEAFYFCIRLAIVDVGNGLKSIGSKAFFSCHRLRSFEFPDGIREIGSWAFQSAGIVEIVIPPSINVIKEGCFSESMLRRVTLPPSLVSIEDNAFANCRLDTLIVSSSTSVSPNAFVRDSVYKIVSKESDRMMSEYKIGYKEFDRMVSVLERKINKKNKITVDYSSGEMEIGSDVHLIRLKDLVYKLISYPINGEEYGIVVVTDDYWFSYPQIIQYASGHIKIPEVIEIIGGPYPEKYIVAGIEARAFENNKKITRIDIPSSVSTFGIGDNAFRGTGITEMKLPAFMDVVPSGLFADSEIKKISFPQGIKKIESGAFSGCKELISVTLNQSVVIIGERAFAGCSNLKSITLPKSVTIIEDHAFQGCVGLDSLTIESGLTTIGDSAFKGTPIRYLNYDCMANVPAKLDNKEKLLTVVIGPSVTAIGDSAFFSCKELSSIDIPTNVFSIGSYAFSYCKGLTSIDIPTNVVSIGSYAFSDCNGLTSIVIPSSVTTIGEFAFSHCNGLTSVTLTNGVKCIGIAAFLGCRNLKTITIPRSITTIDNRAFRSCSALTSITIPNSVTAIGNEAFRNCDSLTSIVIPPSVVTIGRSAFLDCRGLTSVTLSKGLKEIGEYAFRGCGIESLKIPCGVEKIGRLAFDCYNNVLREVEICGNPCEWKIEEHDARIFGINNYFHNRQLKIHLKDAKYADCAALIEYKDKVVCP